jgi:hypothetical protein
VFIIETEITQKGAALKAKEWVDDRNRATRKKRWAETEDEIAYTGRELDRSVGNPSQIRQVVQTMKPRSKRRFFQRARKHRRP